MRDKKNAHKLKCVEASLDKEKKLIMRVSMCPWAPGKGKERMWP